MDNINMEFINPFISELKFNQSHAGEEKYIQLKIEIDSIITKVHLVNPHPLENVFGIVEAKRIWIEDEGFSQKDYGRYKIGYSDEAYCEFWVDSIEQETIE